MELQTVAILNLLKGPPGNILQAMVSSRQPVGVKQLARLTGWGQASVIAGLQKLEMMGWVERTRRYNGWVLTSLALRSVLPRIFPAVYTAAPGPTPGENSEICNSIPGRISGDKQDPEGSSEFCSSPINEQAPALHILNGKRELCSSPQLPEPFVIAGLDGGSCDSCSSPDPPPVECAPRRYPRRKKRPASCKIRNSQPESEEVHLTQVTAVLSSSDSDSPLLADTGPPPPDNHRLGTANVSKILAATKQLFGERVMGASSRYPDPVRLLAAIAEAYDQRQLLRKPARVVFKNMRIESNIDPDYFYDPCSYLPESFLRAAGLPASPSPKPEYSRYIAGLPEDGDGEENENWFASDLPEPDPSLSLLVGDPPARTARAVWDQVIAVLESQIRREILQNYLRDASLVRFDPTSNTFTVAVRDNFVRAWLQDRLARTVSSLLLGICNHPASVIFIVDDHVAGAGGFEPLEW